MSLMKILLLLLLCFNNLYGADLTKTIRAQIVEIEQLPIDNLDKSLTRFSRSYQVLNTLINSLIDLDQRKDDKIFGHHVTLFEGGINLFFHSADVLFSYLRADEIEAYHPINIIFVDHITNSLKNAYSYKKVRRIFKGSLHHQLDSTLQFNHFLSNVYDYYNKSLIKKNLDVVMEYKTVDRKSSGILLYSQLAKQTKLYKEYLLDSKVDIKYKDSFMSSFGDMFHSLSSRILSSLSWAYGSLAGNIKWRKGHLRNNKTLKDEISKKLKPLDIIFEKRSFVLTDYSIPGLWGHASIWLGTKEDLVALGIWDHPVLQPFQEQIINGNSMYEVRRWGLQFNNLETFLNLDQFAAIRVTDLLDRPKEGIIEIYDFLFSQIGKKYDFLFDAMTTDKVTCTEIISFSYGSINWPMEFIFGRHAITPNNIAELAVYKNSPVKLVHYVVGEKKKKVIEKNLVDFAKGMGFIHNDIRSKLEGVSSFNMKVKSCFMLSDNKRKCIDHYTEAVYKKPTIL